MALVFMSSLSLSEKGQGSLVDMALSCAMFYCDFDAFDSVQANKVFNKNSKANSRGS